MRPRDTSQPARREIDFLQHLRVLELGGTTVTGAAGSYLSALGARVTTIGGERGLDRCRPSLGGRSYLRRALDEGKHVASAPDRVPGDSIQRLIELADVVVCDVEGRLPAALQAATADEYLARVADCNRALWVSVAPFGLTGPNRDLRGGEMVNLASGGFLAYLRSTADGKPTKLVGQQAAMLTGEVAGLAALHGLEQVRTGRARLPLHLEVSAQEAILATGPFLNCAWALFNCPSSAGTGRYGTPAGLFECLDGEILLYVMEDRHWSGLVAAMGYPEWAGDLDGIDRRLARNEAIRDAVAGWTRLHTKEVCITALQRHGVPASPVNRAGDVLSSAQLTARDFFGSTRDGLSGLARLPARVIGYDPPRGPQPAPPSGRPLRVLELAQVLGPPIAASLAGAMGAEVIKVEDSTHVDVYRRLGPFADGIEGLERSANFAATNHSKKSVELDLATATGRSTLQRLMDTADVVVENVNPSRLARFGVDAERFLRGRGGRLYVSSSGFGRSGPYADYRAFGQNVGAFAGLIDLSRDAEGAPVAISTPWADLATALFLAGVMIAFGHSDRRCSWHVDVSMGEVVIRHFAEHLLAEASGFDGTREAANELQPHAPNGVYRTATRGTWLALSVETDAEWAALKQGLGDPPELASATYLTAAGRYGGRAALDAAVERATAGLEAEMLFRRLQGIGVRACPVLDAAALVADPHLAARQFFVELSHPDWGARRLVGLPWRPAGKGPLPLGPTARLGQHNRELLGAIASPATGETAR